MNKCDCSSSPSEHQGRKMIAVNNGGREKPKVSPGPPGKTNGRRCCVRSPEVNR